MQASIPFIFMRGGTSRGPYFRRADLPDNLDMLADVLVRVMGSGHKLNIDGIGGGNAVTTKVAMLSRSETEGCDVDYFFAQVGVENGLVDFKPTCGNIMAGVGPAAIEMGLVKPSSNVTEINIHAVNTGAKVRAVLQTPEGQITYDGNAVIDGVPGQAAPIELNFMEVAGSSTGAFLPTGNLRDEIDGIEVTCMDVAMPMVIARAADFGLTGYETAEELDANSAFFSRMEAIRIQAGNLMGMGDVRDSVTPKFGLLAPAQGAGSIATRYFMPWTTHPTMAVTGSQCLASCAITKGTIAEGLWTPPKSAPATVTLEHPLGLMDVIMNWEESPAMKILSAGIVRTARKLAQGEVFVPQSVWKGIS